MLKQCLLTLFRNDVSSARPDGSMSVHRLYWWEHNCKDGQYSSKTVHQSLRVTLKESVELPSSVDDYQIEWASFGRAFLRGTGGRIKGQATRFPLAADGNPPSL